MHLYIVSIVCVCLLGYVTYCCLLILSQFCIPHRLQVLFSVITREFSPA